MSVLTNNEIGRGWTHLKVIQGVDLTETTDSTAQTIPVAVIPAGSIEVSTERSAGVPVPIAGTCMPPRF